MKDEWDLKFRGSSTRARSDTGLMIIKLRKYNSAKELLIGSQNAGSREWVYDRSMEKRVSVTKAAIRMKETGNGARGKRQECIQLASDPGMREDAGPPVLGPVKGHQ